MIVTQADARRILNRVYPTVKVRLTVTQQLMNVPLTQLAAGTPMLVWKKLTSGPHSAVKIGKVTDPHDMRLPIDWNWSI